MDEAFDDATSPTTQRVQIFDDYGQDD